jgi:hypothetical protein
MSFRTRIRYNREVFGKQHKVPREVLVTLEDDFFLYFGIAACNLKVDQPIKKLGRELASVRAKGALSEFRITPVCSFVVASNRMSGRVIKDQDYLLFDYFTQKMFLPKFKTYYKTSK